MRLGWIARRVVYTFLLSATVLLFIYKFNVKEKGGNRKSKIEADYLYQIPITWDLPWYFNEGGYKPTPVESTRSQSLWPRNDSDDRIVTQLMYVPEIPEGTVKKIYLPYTSYIPFKGAEEQFRDGHCPVSNCIITPSMKDADAVIFKDIVRTKRKSVPTNQIWIMFLLESPLNSPKKYQDDAINWTATYRRDSEIVTPYAKWVYYHDRIHSKEQSIDYAFGKTKKVAWIVSNCRASNHRMEYALELQKYISVDIFGSCGLMTCPRREIFDCFEMLSKHYKFYLSFENGNCIDYITEKFYHNGLGFDVIPIVMGARREDYEKVAPYHSYIHVEDFEDAKSLANYLHILDQNDTLYNSYFTWKGTGEFVNTHFFCRLCAMLNDNSTTRMYKNFTRWWNKPGTCVKDRWDRAT